MPQLDRLLSVMVSNRAEALRLVENELASLVKDGATVPVDQAGAWGHAAARTAARDRAAGCAAPSRRRSARGVPVSEWRRRVQRPCVERERQVDGRDHAGVNGGTPAHRRRRSPRRRCRPPDSIDGGGPCRSAAARPRRAIAGGRGSHRACGDRQPAPTARGAGRVGSAPSVRRAADSSPARRDGAARRRATARRSDAHAHAATSIMPERNRTEYAETNDTDFAYEIPGLARFRANVFRERKGAGAVLRVIPAKVVSAEELGISSEVQALCQLTKGPRAGHWADRARANRRRCAR